MGMLAKLIKTVISAVLLNKTVRSAFIVTLIKSAKWILRPSTISRIMAFFGRLAKSAPGISKSNAALSAIAALLLAMMRGREDSPGASSKRQKDKIIDIDEYTIVDDRH